MSQRDYSLRGRIIIEITWLLLHWGISLVLLGWLIGIEILRQPALDIQMHNTYFVIPAGLAPLPIFLLEATLITGIRMLVNQFQNKFTNWIFVVLVTLSVSMLFWVIRSIH